MPDAVPSGGVPNGGVPSGGVQRNEDPVVRSGRREATWTLGVWLLAGIYTVSYCTLHGYGQSDQPLSYVLWFPSWVFWGIVVPWLACVAFSTWFALCYMEDDPLASQADVPTEDDAEREEPAHG